MSTTNILRNVITYTDSMLGRLQNQNPWIFQANKRYREFNSDFPQNLGATVSFSLPTRYQSQRNTGLFVTFQGTQQRIQTLTCDQDATVAPAFSDQELIFNVENDVESFVVAGSNVIGNAIGADLAGTAITGPYRQFGDGITAISTYQQLDQAIKNFQDFGAASGNLCMFLDLVSIPAIIGTGLSQFATNRNNDIANSWEVGRFDNCDFYQTNLLQIHTAGAAGEAGTELTVTNVDPTGRFVTFSGAPANEPIAIAAYDIITFNPPGATNQTGLRVLNFAGYTASSQPVQVSVVSDASSDGSGNVTVEVYPPLIYSSTDPNANLNQPIAPLYGTLNATIPPSHKAGLLMSGNPLFLAMPILPDKDPYMTAISVDKESGASLRTYRGSTFDTNQTATVTQCLWGKTFARDYGMRIIYPLNTPITFGASFGSYNSHAQEAKKSNKKK